MKKHLALRTYYFASTKNDTMKLKETWKVEEKNLRNLPSPPPQGLTMKPAPEQPRGREERRRKAKEKSGK